MNAANLTAFIKDNAIVVLGTIIFNLKAFILMPLIIKNMGVEVYGGYILLITLLGISCNLSGLGVGISAKRYLPSAETMDDRRELFYPQFIFVILAALAVAIGLYLADDYIRPYLFDKNVSYSPAVIIAYMVAYVTYAQGIDYFRFTSRVPRMTVMSTVFPYLHMSNIIVLLYFFDLISIDVLVLSEAFSAGIIGLICFVTIFKEIGFKLQLYRLNELAKEIRLGLPLTLTLIVDFILAASDRYLLAMFLSVTAVGYYHPGYLVGSLVMFLPKAMGMVLPQFMSKAVDRGDEKSAIDIIDHSIKFYLLISIPFVFGTVIIGKPLLALLANQTVAENAYLVAPIVASGIIFFGLTYIFTCILLVKLQTSMMLKVNMLAASINLLANVILLYFFRDILVAALTTLLSYIVSFAYIHHKLRAFWPVRFEIGFIVKVTIAALLMTGASFALHDGLGEMSDWGQIFILTPFAVLVYAVALFLTRAITKQEIAGLKTLLRKRGVAT